MKNPNRKDPPEEAREILILYIHLLKEAIVIFAHGHVDLREADICTLQTL